MSPAKCSLKGKKKESFTKKAPGAPKRFKSSYILFFIQSQEKIKKELPPGSRTAPLVSKRASELWKKLPDDERAFWDQEAEKEKRRYIIEKESYTGPWQVPCKRAKKDPTAPRRNPSAFLLYSVKKRTEIKNQNPDMKTTEISRILGQMWNDASEEEKRPFIEREEVEREEYKKRMNAWKMQKEILDQEHSLKSLDSNDCDDDWSISDSEHKKDQENHATDIGKLQENKTIVFTNDSDTAPTVERTPRYQCQPVLSAQPTPTQFSPNPAPSRLRSESWKTPSLKSPLHPHNHSTYRQQHVLPHSLTFPHIEDMHSMPFMDQSLSPIPVFRSEQDPPVLYPRPGLHHPSNETRRHAPYGWPTPQPSYSYQQYKYPNPDAITSMGYNITPQEPMQTKRHHIFQHDSELGCSPFGSYDELDTPIDPLPIH